MHLVVCLCVFESACGLAEPVQRTAAWAGDQSGDARAKRGGAAIRSEAKAPFKPPSHPCRAPSPRGPPAPATNRCRCRTAAVPQDDFRAGKSGAVAVNATGFLYDDLVVLNVSRLLAPGWHKMTVQAKTGNTEHKGVQTGAPTRLPSAPLTRLNEAFVCDVFCVLQCICAGMSLPWAGCRVSAAQGRIPGCWFACVRCEGCAPPHSLTHKYTPCAPAASLSTYIEVAPPCPPTSATPFFTHALTVGAAALQAALFGAPVARTRAVGRARLNPRLICCLRAEHSSASRFPAARPLQ